MTNNALNPDDGILVVDDHLISRQFACKTLQCFTKNIKQVTTGYEAISTIRDWWPALIITDIHLPDYSGLRLVQKIRTAWPRERTLPHIVIITGDDSSHLKEQVAQLGVTRMLLKPVSAEDIKACARQLIFLDNSVNEMLEQYPATVMDHELRELFSRELITRLPRLDWYISHLDWKPGSEILHQLIASSALCGEKELEKSSRLLYRAVNIKPEPDCIAQAYYPFLRAAAHAIMRFRPVEPARPSREQPLPGR